MKLRTSRLLWAAALLLLAAVLVFVNLPGGGASESDAREGTSSVPLGTQAGERLPDFTVKCVDGGVFTLSELRGKVVVLNLWATWCTPCVRELPNFDRLCQERGGEVAVLAIHVAPVTTDVREWLSGFSHTMPFAVDEDGSLGELLNASTVLPQTIVLDAQGVVTYNREGSLGYEELAELVAAAERGE
jgi:thiol-disulfide isomerase/thioredoxin